MDSSGLLPSYPIISLASHITCQYTNIYPQTYILISYFLTLILILILIQRHLGHARSGFIAEPALPHKSVFLKISVLLSAVLMVFFALEVLVLQRVQVHVRQVISVLHN